MKDKRTEQQILADIRKELLGLEQRAMTANQVQGAIWKLWGFVRDNQNSLDSEHCCKMIQEVINGAVSAVNSRAAILSVELDAVREELRDSKKEVKQLTKQVEIAYAEIGKLSSQLSNAQDEIERLQAMLFKKASSSTAEDHHPDAA